MFPLSLVMKARLREPPETAYTSPPLTTVRQDRIQLGKSGFNALSGLLNGVPLGTVLLHADLIVRDSTSGPART